MSNIAQLRVISSAEILQLSPRYPVTYQDDELLLADPLGGYVFPSDEEAILSTASERNAMTAKLDIPLALPMHGAYRPKDSNTRDRKDTDFRIVLADREVAPAEDEACTVMPYILFQGITSLALRVLGEEDDGPFGHDAFWLNIFEPGVSQPFSEVDDAILQVTINPNELPAEDVLARYLILKQRAGRILQRIVNAPVTIPQGE